MSKRPTKRPTLGELYSTSTEGMCALLHEKRPGLALLNQLAELFLEAAQDARLGQNARQAGHHASPAGDLLEALDEGHRRAGEEVRPVPPAELAQALG